MCLEYTSIDKNTLRDLLEGYYYYIALASGGVDNWEWYGDSINQFVEEIDPDIFPNDTSPIEDIDDLVKRELDTYLWINYE